MHNNDLHFLLFFQLKCCRQLKPFGKTGTHLHYHAMDTDALAKMSQGISNHGIDLVLWAFSKLTIMRVNCQSVMYMSVNHYIYSIQLQKICKKYIPNFRIMSCQQFVYIIKPLDIPFGLTTIPLHNINDDCLIGCHIIWYFWIISKNFINGWTILI